MLALFTGEPSGLLVAIAAVCICLGWKAGLAATAAGGLICALILMAPGYAVEPGLVRFVAFVAATFGLWLVIKIFRTISFYDRVYQGAGPNVTDIPGLGWSAYPDGRLRFVNSAVLDYLGVTVEEMREIMDADDFSWWLRFVHPDDVDTSMAQWRHSVETGEPMLAEQRLRRFDGSYRWFRDSGVASRDERGRIVGWYGHTEDIDDRRKAEAALRQSERELRLLVDTVPTMIWLMTPAGLPYYFNKRFVDWAGIESAKEPRGTRQFASHVELFHPDDRAAVKAVFQKSFARGEALQHKARLCRKDGEYRWIDSRFEPLRDEDGTIVRWYGVNFDIDDQVRAQEALRLADERLARALRAASLSELSVSIAHELNQPLQAVVANAGAFQRWLTADPPNFDHAGRVAQKIIRNADAAAQVIGRIRSLFSKTEGEPQPLDLNALIREVCELMGDRLASSRVMLELDLDPELPATAADHVQMEQVVLNLVRNGIEAMQDVSTTARSLRIVSRGQDDGTVEVEVRDRGRGLSDPERIFEAFYTTKPDGMGMGLPICRSIVEAHYGRVWAKNVEGGGASIIFSLPIRAADPSATRSAATISA
ncbi:PAS domain-containing sensor histidine kinase [Mesorhizobium japonicum]|uniref:PAS domain-containing sensor histidine kinase n=1 Tax=Mesorhizobium japonicum TaxID=2066070 RepID=UPI001FCC5F4D|nr:PAS domain-containing sensor histidine kinase [Mesorhizobium japonicum]